MEQRRTRWKKKSPKVSSSFFRWRNAKNRRKVFLPFADERCSARITRTLCIGVYALGTLLRTLRPEQCVQQTIVKVFILLSNSKSTAKTLLIKYSRQIQGIWNLHTSHKILEWKEDVLNKFNWEWIFQKPSIQFTLWINRQDLENFVQFWIMSIAWDVLHTSKFDIIWIISGKYLWEETVIILLMILM